MANGYAGNRIQNITQTLELEAAEENYRGVVAVESFSFRYSNSSKYTTYAHKQMREFYEHRVRKLADK